VESRKIDSPRPREPRGRRPARSYSGRACASASRGAAALGAAFALAAAGCGGNAGTTAGATGAAAGGAPPPVSSPLTPHEQLIAAGGNLAISDGCSTCHMAARSGRLGPSFYDFAGHAVQLANGRTVLVDEAFVKRELEHPEGEPMSGYNPRLMWNTMRRLHVHLNRHAIDALAAFVEQIGPEP